VSLSVYETARLVALAPWLEGHGARLEFLCAQQAVDGSWGPGGGYAFVPTLSATEALLASLRRPSDAGALSRQRIAQAAVRGLRALDRWLEPGSGFAIPDTIAVEVIAPALVGEINEHLEQLRQRLDADWPRSALPLPEGITPASSAAIRAALGRDDVHSRKLWASLEAFGGAAAELPFIQPEAGAVGCSPAATAAWLTASPEDDRDARGYLRELQARGGGPVPGVTPITYFEPAWILNSLATGGVEYTPPGSMLDTLESGLTEHGAPAGVGLPPDSDDTAGVLYALARHGRPRRPDCLMYYRADGYFTCFPSERTPSTSTNAHILEALRYYVAHHPQDRRRYSAAMKMVVAWLLAEQQLDGSWYDKWHASAYYATACVALALSDFAADRSGPALARAVEWTLATQRRDGSWGRWGGTVEETAYAVQVLLRARVPERAAEVAEAAVAGCVFLETADDRTHRGLWHAKDLFAPIAVIRGARLAALSLRATTTGAPPKSESAVSA
jgi:hypothetical protein